MSHSVPNFGDMLPSHSFLVTTKETKADTTNPATAAWYRPNDCVVETASGDTAEAWSASGQSPSHPDAPACQGHGAAGVDKWTQLVSVCQTPVTFCPEHEVAETEATKLMRGLVIIMHVSCANMYCGMNVNNCIHWTIMNKWNIKPVRKTST